MKKVSGDFYLQKLTSSMQNKDEMREQGMGNGERGTGNGEWGMGNGEWGTGNGELGTMLMNDRIKHFTNASNAFLESF